MSRIYKICKIFRIRETGLQVRKDLNVYRLRPYRRARACPSPASVSPKASSPGGLSYRQAPSLSVEQDRPILTCSRSGDRELQRSVSRRRGDRGGQAPALRFGRKLILKILEILKILLISCSYLAHLVHPAPNPAHILLILKILLDIHPKICYHK